MTDYYVLHSGGLDSTVALALCTQLDDARRIVAVGVDYGQRHRRELEAAQRVRDTLEVPGTTIDLTGFGASVSSALTGQQDVPEGAYSADSIAATTVPGRNAVMLAAAAGFAASSSGSHPAVIVTAIHASDSANYPDCSPLFATQIDAALRTGAGVGVDAPFADNSKTDIVELGHQVRAPMHQTWSCYRGDELHCGTCGTCLDRRHAFAAAGVDDPTQYATQRAAV